MSGKVAAFALAAGLAGAAAAGCGGDCCTVDSLPIPMTRAPVSVGGAAGGALVALASSPAVAGGAPFAMVVDTASPVTVLSGAVGDTSGALHLEHRSFDLLDATAPAPQPLRASFHDIGLLDFPLNPAGDPGTVPLGVLGGDLLKSFSVEIRFAGSTVTFWHHLGASPAFLEDAGYAALRFSLYGGGEVSAQGDPDVFGSRGPLILPPTRVVLRACAAPRVFVPTEPRELCCTRGAEVTLSTGVDLSLLVSTGVGPLVLSQSAWARVAAKLPAAPALAQGDLLVATWPTAIPAGWATIPRLALVDLEAGSNADPGPCVELGRSRRIEWVSYQQVMGPTNDACYQVCDTDPRQPDLAQNSAAYLELGGTIPVAVVADDDPFLQSLRFDIRPEGPEIDGLVGAGALGQARMELDYTSTPARAVLSCEPTATRDACWAAARCPRLPDRDQQHYCFGLGLHRLPAMCAPSGC
jgi:hypothetical protein